MPPLKYIINKFNSARDNFRSEKNIPQLDIRVRTFCSKTLEIDKLGNFSIILHKKNNLVSRIIPDKALRDQTFDIAKDPSVDEF